MAEQPLTPSRRSFLAAAAATALVSSGESAEHHPLSWARPAAPSPRGRQPLAVLASVYRPLSEAYHLVGRFLHGYPRAGHLHIPRQAVASLYVQQAPPNDLSKEIAREHNIRLARTIEDALIQGGKLAVEAVLLIAEHGNYPRNDKGQVLYPRFEWLEEVVRVFREVGKTAPVFVARQLSYSPGRARRMAGWSADLGFQLLAGSYLPVVWRRPELELRPESPVEEALVVGFGGLEVGGFHGLETLQAMVERRHGGETGIRAVTCLVGKDVWRAGDAGLWSWELLEAALARSETVNLGDVRRNTGSMAVFDQPATPPTALLIEYRDGTHGTVLLLNGHLRDFVFSARLRGESRPVSCLFVTPPPPGARAYDAQAVVLEEFFAEGKRPAPPERELLTAGILDAIMESHHRRSARVETPDLDLRYEAPAEPAFLRGQPGEH